MSAPDSAARTGWSVPLGVPLVLVVAGIGIGSGTVMPAVNVLLGLLAVLLLLAGLAIWRKKNGLALLALGCFFMLGGAVLEQQEEIKYYEYSKILRPFDSMVNTGQVVRLEADTLSMPAAVWGGDAKAARVLFRKVSRQGKMDKLELPGQLTVVVPAGQTLEWNRGDRISFLAKIDLPKGYRNRGQWPAEYYYNNRNILLLASCKHPALLERTVPAPADALSRLYGMVEGRLDQVVEGNDVRQVLKALLLGSPLEDAELRNSYADAGIYHLLVISGLHLVMLATVLLALSRLANLPQIVSGVAIITLLILYTMFVQANLPVVRALIMISCYLAGRLLFARAPALNALALAALLLLCWKPWYLVDAGFLLSFLAVLALVSIDAPLSRTLVEPLRQAGGRLFGREASLDDDLAAVRARRWRFVMEGFRFLFFPAWPVHSFQQIFRFATRGAALVLDLTLANWCVLTLLLPVFSLFHLPAGLAGLWWTGPALAIVWPVQVLLLAVPLLIPVWPFLADCCLKLAAILAEEMNRVVLGLAPAPVWIPPAAPFLMILLAAGLTVWYLPRWRGRGWVLLLLPGFLAAVWLLPSGNEAVDRLHLLDVREGDAILLASASGRFLLVDTGGVVNRSSRNGAPAMRTDLARRVVIPALLENGARKLDGLVLTHFDADHAGAAPSLLQSFPVERLYCSATEARRPSLLREEIFQVAARQGIPVQLWSRGDRLALGAMKLAVLSPPRDGPVGEANANSLVLRGESGPWSFLLAADITAQQEMELEQQRLVSPASILKSPHHGSKTSNSRSFLQALLPGLAVISAGSPERFSHPSPEVLQRLAALRIPWRTTFEDGEIVVVFRQTVMEIRRPAAEAEIQRESRIKQKIVYNHITD